MEIESIHQEVKLNDPFRLPSDSKKKFAVYVKNKNGKVIKVSFGDPNMEIKRDDPERLKSFRARHKCDLQKDKTSAAYWSCKMWEKNKSVTDVLNEGGLYLTAIAKNPKDPSRWLFWNGRYFTRHEVDRKTYKQKTRFKRAEAEAKLMGYVEYQLVDRPIWLPGVNLD